MGVALRRNLLRTWLLLGLSLLLGLAGYTAAGGDLLARGESDGLAQRGAELLQSGELERSVPYLRRLYAIEPHNDSARYALGLALLLGPIQGQAVQSQERLAECIALLTESARRAAAVNATGAFVAERWFYLALANWHAGQSDQALGLFERSFRADRTGRSDALFNRAAIFEELGRFAEADQAWSRLARVAPIDSTPSAAPAVR